MVITSIPVKEIFYPTEDEEQLAETREHFEVISNTFSILSEYLEGKAVVFSDQFLYYIEGNPEARLAPDVMVVFDVPLKEYGNYKIWEGQEIPAIIFEMTSESTRSRDWEFKKNLYAELGVKEYWLFDPYGEWIPQQLQGYFLTENNLYQPIGDNCSQVLGLRLQPNGYLIRFDRLDTAAKLLTLWETQVALKEADQRAKEADRKAKESDRKAQVEKARADRLAEKLRELGIDV